MLFASRLGGLGGRGLPLPLEDLGDGGIAGAILCEMGGYLEAHEGLRALVGESADIEGLLASGAAGTELGHGQDLPVDGHPDLRIGGWDYVRAMANVLRFLPKE